MGKIPIARDAVVPLIYRRIVVLETRDARIFRVDGIKLGGDVPQWRGEDLPCRQLTREDVIHRIDCAEHVSFDIFDTLLGRRFLHLEDLYAEVERQFPRGNWDSPLNRHQAGGAQAGIYRGQQPASGGAG